MATVSKIIGITNYSKLTGILKASIGKFGGIISIPPYTIDSYTKLLLHMDGTNGSTTFTDEIGKTVTANGNAQISTAQYAPLTGNTASGYFDGSSGTYANTGTSSDWNFGTDDWTIDFWVRYPSLQHNVASFFIGNTAATSNYIALFTVISTDRWFPDVYSNTT